MVEIQQLYGVVHGGSISFLFLEAKAFLKPSTELLDDLSKLPSGTRVGIEEASSQEVAELSDLVVDGVKVGLDAASTSYWGKIREHCERHSLAVVHLEDITRWKAYLAKTVEAHKIRLEMRETEDQSKWQELNAKMYTAETEAEQIHVIQREEQLLKNMKEQNLHTAILGRGHTDIIYAQAREGKLPGITFNNYAAEDMPDLEPARERFRMFMGMEMRPTEEDEKYISEHLQPNPFTRNPVADPMILGERESLARRYRAIKTGRITDGNPDYIGTWDLSVENRGLFEMFITERDGSCIEGTIEDVNGSGKFEGVFDSDDLVVFDKTYTPPVSNTAAKGVIRYRATEKNGVWEGDFRGNDCRGRFWMKSRSA